MKKPALFYKNFIILSIMTLLLVGAAPFLHADVVELTDGTTIAGLVIQETDEEIMIQQVTGIVSINRSRATSISRDDIGELAATQDGVVDVAGRPLPPPPAEILIISSRMRATDDQGKASISERYFSLAQKYEARAKAESREEVRQALLMTSLLYYRIVSLEAGTAIRTSSMDAMWRCFRQLYNPRRGTTAIPYGANMTEHIEHDIESYESEEIRSRFADLYLKMGKDREAEADISQEQRAKNLNIALNCYRIVAAYSSDSASRQLARQLSRQCHSKLTTP